MANRPMIEVDLSEFYPDYPEMRKAKEYPGTMPPEYTVKRARKAKGKNPNIYKHIVKDANGNTYEVNSKFPGKANLGEVMSRKFMDRSATIKGADSHVNGKGVSKPDERDRASNKSFSKKMSEKHFNETSAEPTSNSATKSSVWNKLKNTKVGNWLRNTKVGGYFSDSPLRPMNTALIHKGGWTIKGWPISANPVAYAVNTYGMGSGGGYMPIGEGSADIMRVENHPEDLISSFTSVVPINEKGTVYLDPKLGIKNTEVVTDSEGWKYYRNAQTGQFEPLERDTPYKDYSPLPRVKEVKESYPINGIPTINDILGGALSMPMGNTPLPIPPMYYDSDANKPLPPMSADVDEIPSGKIVVGPDTEAKSTQSAQSITKPTVASVVKPKRVAKPTVVNNTSVAKPDIPVSTPIPPVSAPTLSSVATQAVRHNGGFDNYRRESVLSALRAAGGISPAEAVQRGIIPWEALNYV